MLLLMGMNKGWVGGGGGLRQQVKTPFSTSGPAPGSKGWDEQERKDKDSQED